MMTKARLLFLSILATSFLFVSTTAYAQPVNDNCQNATVIPIGNAGYSTGTFISTQSDLTNATVETGETFYSTISSAGQTDKSVWYIFTLPTARKCVLYLKQPTPLIAGNDAGFTVYLANTCFPTSVQADSALLASQTVFGYSTNPCLKAGTYMVQVSANASADGPIYIQLDISPSDPAPYDQQDSAYTFGVINSSTLSNCGTYKDVSLGCYSLDNGAEVCPALGANYSQSVWYTFTTDSYFDAMQFDITPTVWWSWLGNPVIGYNIYKGNALTQPYSSLVHIAGCEADTLAYPDIFHLYKCNTLLPNTTYSVDLLFDKNDADDVDFAIEKVGTQPGSSPRPTTTGIAAGNKLGALPQGTTTATDYFGCNTEMASNPCGTTNPAAGVYIPSVNTTYDLALWYTFQLTQAANISISAYTNNSGYNYIRIFNRNVTASCTNLDTTNLEYEFQSNGTINCLPAGNYTMQILGSDTMAYYYSLKHYYGNCGIANNLGNQLNVSINVTSVRLYNNYALITNGEVDTLLRTGTAFGGLQPDTIYSSTPDTFGCGNTALPAGGDCSGGSTTDTKAIYTEFKIASPDSGFVYMSFSPNWNYWYNGNILYQGNASSLANTQNSHFYPDTITGLTPSTPCISNQYWCIPLSRSCVRPGIYTLVTFGDSTVVGDYSSATVQLDTTHTIHYSAALAENMGNILDSMGGGTNVTSQTDYYSCLDNPLTIGGQAPCDGYNGTATRTKLIYRQFYLSQPEYISITVGYNCGYVGVFSLFNGKATNGVGTLTPVGSPWVCSAYASSPPCTPLPAGWYTVVSYGEGPSYANPTVNYYGNYGNGGDLGMQSTITIIVTAAPPGPKYDRPGIAAIDTITNQPFLIKHGNTGTPAFPVTDTTYFLPTEHYDCTTDTPFYLHPLDPCDSTTHHRVTYYIFTLPQESYIRLEGINDGNVIAQIYPGNARTTPGILRTATAVQPCMSNPYYVEVCRMQPGTYTLVYLIPDNYDGYSISPYIYIDTTGYSRFDHAQAAYDFGVVPPDSAWHNGKVGAVNPLNPARAPSDDFFYCTTGAYATDPAYAPCYTDIDSFIYRTPQTNNYLYSDTGFPADGSSFPRRNLWYTFVLNGGGNCEVQVLGMNPATSDVRFTIYQSDVNGTLPFTTVQSTGQVDSTLAQGLTYINTNVYFYYYCPDIGNTISFHRNPCTAVPTRYYIIAESMYEVNSQIEVSILWDTISTPSVHYDHYFQANPINITSQGQYTGGIDNFTCATVDSTEPNSSGCNPRTLWYKVTVPHAGKILLNYYIDSLLHGYDYNLTFYRQTVPGDSTPVGLQPVSLNNIYDNNTNAYWGEACVYPGTYYIIMTGCNFPTNFEQPILQYDTTQVRFDNYFQADSVSVPGDGTYYGRIANYTCATSNVVDPSPTGCNPRNLWYKITVGASGYLSLNYLIDSVLHGYDGELTFFRQTIPGDSTSAGLQYISLSSIYDNTSNSYWGRTCVYPGTYYVIMTGCYFFINNEQPKLWFQQDSGDYCSNAISGTVSTPGSIALSAVIDCATIGEGFGEDGSNMGCLIPTGQNVSSYKSVWYEFTIPPGDTFDVTPTLDNLTNLPDDLIRYRILYGNCTAMNTGSCFVTANTVNTFNCLAAGTYFIQVVTPDVNQSYQTSVGTIQMNIGSVKSPPGCNPVNTCFVVPLFSTSSPCSTDSVYFINQSTEGDSIIYHWNFGYNNQTSTLKNPAFLYPTPVGLSTNYTVRLIVTNLACHKTDSITHTITVYKKPKFNLGRDTAFCAAYGSAFNITLNAATWTGTTYLWQDGTTNSTMTTTYYNYSSIAVNQFYVAATYNNCTVYDTITVTVNQIPVVNLGSDVTLCAGQQFSGYIYNGIPGETYLWSNGVTTYTYATDTPGTYWARVTTGAGCKASDTVVVSNVMFVHPLPRDTVMCPGGSLTLNSTTAGATSYSWDNASSNPIRTVTDTGTYWVQMTVSGCTITDSVTVRYVTLTRPDITGDTILCLAASDSLQLDAGAGYSSYHWSTGAATRHVYVHATGHYSVTVSNGGGCSLADTITVTSSPLMTLTSIDSNVKCYGQSNGKITLNVAGGTLPLSYLWENSSTAPNRTGLAAGIYTVVVTDAAGCTRSQADTITAPVVLKDSLVGVNPICAAPLNGTVNSVITGGTLPYSYHWGGGQTTSNLSALGTGRYSMTVTDKNGCTASATDSLTTPPPISVIYADTPSACYGASTGRIGVTVSGGTLPYSYLWSNGATTKNISGLVASVYRLTVTDHNNCTALLIDTLTQPDSVSMVFSITNISCNGGNTGVISLTASGGTSPLHYTWSNSDTTSTIDSLSIGNYTVTVTDGQNCKTIETKSVSQATGMVIAQVDSNVTCYGYNNGVIKLTVTGGNPGYRYHWNDNDTLSIRRSLTPGIYTVTVTDNALCQQFAIDTITQPDSLRLTATLTPPSCFNSNNGSIVTTLTGGTGAYSYNWGGGIITPGRAGLSGGVYHLTCTDANSCTTTRNFTITAPAAISLTDSITAVSCFNGSNGSISVVASGGKGGVYTYAWSNGRTTATDTGLIAGTYTLTVSDSAACHLIDTFIVSQPGAIHILLTDTNISCAGLTDGSIHSTVTGGTGAYTYLWSNTAATPAISALSANIYHLTVTDANLCTDTASGTIISPAPLAVIDTLNNPTCSYNTNGSIHVSATGGTLPYTLTWNTGLHTAVISNLNAAIYYLTVTDGRSCSLIDTFTLTAPPALSVTATDTNVLCFGVPNGRSAITVSGGTPLYTYLWNDGNAASYRNNLAAGDYTITITDHNSCTAIFHDTITQPDSISLAFVITNISCNGGNTGVINFTASGGTPSYHYIWSNSDTTSTIDSLSIGNYTVTVTDGQNCKTIATKSVSQATGIMIAQADSNVTCYGYNNGVIKLTVTGGNPGYRYHWNDNDTLPIRRSLAPGIYTVTATDNALCQQFAIDTITQPDSLSLTDTVTPPSCFNSNNGSIVTTITGGTGAYSYNWGGGIITPGRAGLSGGVYHLTCTDANSCTTTRNFSITAPAAISLTDSITAVSCFNGSNGSISVVASGGKGGVYTYAWSNGRTTATDTGLISGAYILTVTDSASCHLIDTFFVSQPVAIHILLTDTNISCAGLTDGSIHSTVTGGTGAYTYLWSNTDATPAISALSANTYILTVTDANLCADTASGTIISPAPLAVIDTLNNPTCSYNTNGSIHVSATGGTLPYTFIWNTGPHTAVISNLNAAIYYLSVTDGRSCSLVDTFTLTAPSALSVTATDTNVLCFGVPNGRSAITVSGGTPLYTYLWNDGNATSYRNNLAAGDYTITITDHNSCTAILFDTITQPSAITLSAIAIDANCLGGPSGSILLSVSGGSPGYTYSWSNGAHTQNISGLVPQIYTVIVKDTNLCTATLSDTILTAPGLQVQSAITNVNCSGDTTGVIALTVTNANGTVTYRWNNGDTTQSIINLPAGIYIVTVTDTVGCTLTVSDTVKTPLVLNLSIIDTNISCYGSANGKARVTVSGGTAPYHYLWSTGPATPTIANLIPGSYIVSVTDTNHCMAIDTAIISQPDSISLIDTLVFPTCSYSTNGSIHISDTGGTAPYTYLWSGGSTNPDRNGLGGGVFSVTVTDHNGCRLLRSFTLIAPSSVHITDSITPVRCFNDSNGVITISASGGTGRQYTYAWSNTDNTDSITGLKSGSYIVTVSDSVGCQLTDTFVVGHPLALQIALSDSDITCAGANNGYIRTTVSGGTSPYQYAWSNLQNTVFIQNLAPGPYTLTVTDHNGCTNFAYDTIVSPTALVITDSIVPPLCATSFDASIFITVTGGSPLYSYHWNTGPNQQNLTAVNAGTYYLTVSDSRQCIQLGTFTITAPSPVTAQYTDTAVTCYGGSNGRSRIIASGGTPGYHYHWNDGNTNAYRNNLAAGIYQITVSDTANCNIVIADTILQPQAFIISSVIDSVTCFGTSTGSISLTVAGATPSYTYSWSNTITTSTLTNIPVGTYTVTVTDRASCTTVGAYHVYGPAQLTLSLTADSASCYGTATGSVTPSVNGGTMPYSYLWSNASVAPALTAVPVAIYSLTVTDSRQCTIADTAQVYQPDSLKVSFSTTGILCFGQATGIILTTVSGGTSGYIYAWSNGSNTQSLNGVIAGNYTLTVTDAHQCTSIHKDTISQLPAINIQLTTDTTTCSYSADGSISSAVSGGTAPYSFDWNTTSTNQNLTGLAAGIYSLTVTDFNHCTMSASGTVIGRAALVLDTTIQEVSCYGYRNGSITLVTTGGRGPYDYIWSNGEVSARDTALSIGSYSVTVTDSHNCTTTFDNIPVSQPDSLTIGAVVSNEHCAASHDGTVSLTVTGGTMPYQYNWSGGSTTQNLTSLNAGTYLVTVTDHNGCIISDSARVIISLNETLSSIVKDPFCHEVQNGSITLNVTGTDSPYSYVWADVTANVSSRNDLDSGRYMVTVTDVYGCVWDTSFMLSYDVVIGVNASPDTATIPLGSSVQLMATGIGTGLNYNWTPSTPLSCSDCTDPIAAPIYSTDFIVIASNGTGCTASDTVQITVIPVHLLYVPNAFTPNGDGINDFFEIFGNKTAMVFVNIKIFDRWGEKVFESHDIDFQWDGSYRGVMLGPGVLTYELEVTFADGYNDNRKGAITLIR